MKFEEAVEWMKDGKRVVRRGEHYDFSLYLDDDKDLMTGDGSNCFQPSLDDIEATNWEIYRSSFEERGEDDDWNVAQHFHGDLCEHFAFEYIILKLLKRKILEDEEKLLEKYDDGTFQFSRMKEELKEIKDKRFGF